MVNRNAELQRLGHDPSQCETSLNHFVLEGFNSYGWTKRRTSWRHEQCGHFLEQDILLAKEWKRIAHQLRDSVRWASWKEFCESGRHEIADLELPYMTIDRINMTRKWAAASASRRSFAIRAVKSPKMAHLAHGWMQHQMPEMWGNQSRLGSWMDLPLAGSHSQRCNVPPFPLGNFTCRTKPC